ncbi:MAG: hypothetical protein IIB62_00490 [Proteobacteria bacterium]|nr:hypothetical protein [Pseudomonadota bacterium]
MVQKQSKSSAISKQPDATRTGSRPATKSKLQKDPSTRRDKKLSQRLADGISPSKPDTDTDMHRAGEATLSAADETPRRTAQPARGRIAANDDLPTIGGLIFSLQQRPARTPFYLAFAASIVWLLMCLSAGLLLFNERLSALSSGDILRDPASLTLVATIFVPVTLFWFLALLIWRAHELRLMSAAMTEVAVRLAEPDKLATQTVASLGQTIRRQVAAMNDAISRALGRAGELEALVHNEVATLERSYSENELRIKGLIDGLANERDALANNSERVSETLRGIGTQVASDIADAGDQVTKSLLSATSELAAKLTLRGGKITEAVSAAGAAIDNKLAERGAQITQQLTSQGDLAAKKLDTAGANVSAALIATGDLAARKLDTAGANVSASLKATTAKVTGIVDVKSNALMKSLTDVGDQLVKDIPDLLDRLDGEQKRLSSIISSANHNFSELENAIAKRTTHFDGSLKIRTEELKTVLAERINALDTTMQQQAKSIESTLAANTMEMSQIFAVRSNALDTTMQQQAKAIESSLSANTMAMSQIFAEGTDTLKKTTEQMARQSTQANANLSAQAESLKGVSHKLIEQVHGLIQRFEAQGKAIMSASQALDTSNAQIDSILQRRHAEISSLLKTVSTKAQSLDEMMQSYSGIIEGSLTQLEERAKHVTASLAQETTAQTNVTLAEIERLRTEARQHTEQTVAELTGRFQSISGEIADQLADLTARFSKTTEEMRQKASSTADEIEGTRRELQKRMRDIPEAARHNQEAVRKAVSDQIKALGTLSALTTGNAAGNGAGAPQPPPAYTPQPGSSTPGQTLPPAEYPAPPAAGAAAPASGDLASVTASLASRLGQAAQAPVQTTPPPPPPAEQSQASGLGVNMRNMRDSAHSDQWSLGDLLARASAPDHGAPPVPPALPAPPSAASAYNAPAGSSSELRMNDIASAIDQNTAHAMWQRFRRGERDVFNRQLYTRDGQATFDEISGRYQRDPAFRTTVESYIADFERLLSDAESKGQNSQTIDNYLSSETGRVYLMLAHASGRLQ